VLSIIIVNYNAKKLLQQCLSSVYAETKQIPFDVWVVDNNSDDGSVAMVEKNFPEVKLIKNNENCGFAKANNMAILRIKSDYVLLLNPDTVICDNAIEKVGIDPLIENYKKLGILEDGDVKHLTGVGEELDFSDEAFDMIICFDVLDHSKEPSKVCREMYRVLKKNGSIVFHSPCVISPIKPIRILLKYVDKPHPWHFTSGELNDMFANASFKQSFVGITDFHWKARCLVRHVAAKAIIRNYFAIFQK